MTITVVSRDTGTGWVPDVETFGARLALVRQRMGWGNVAEAAKACGLPVGSWRNWERDGRAPRNLTTVAKQIAGVTGCSYQWLVLGPDAGGGRVTPEYPRRPMATEEYGRTRSGSATPSMKRVGSGERVVTVAGRAIEGYEFSPGKGVTRTRPLTDALRTDAPAGANR